MGHVSRIPTEFAAGGLVVPHDRPPGAAALPAVAAAESCVRAAVDRCWQGILGRTDPGISWDAAGGDSLRFMRLVVELEKILGTSLPPGAFRLDMTQSEVAAAAAAALGLRRPGPDEARCTVFLCPGSVGDGPALARLREETGRRVEWVTLRYPDWRETPANRAGVAQVASAVAREVAARQPLGAVRLAGYSFGGPVAAEAAALLEAQGRQVAFLGVLDACIVSVAERPAARIARAVARLGAGLDSPWRILLRRVVRRLVRSGRAELVPALAARLPAGLAFLIELEAGDVVRTLAFRDWVASAPRPRPACQVTLFRSQEARSGAPGDLGWSEVAARVAVVDVPGTHLGMIHPPHRSLTAARLGLAILPPDEAA